MKEGFSLGFWGREGAWVVGSGRKDILPWGKFVRVEADSSIERGRIRLLPTKKWSHLRTKGMSLIWNGGFCWCGS